MIFKKKPEHFEFKHNQYYANELFPIRPAQEYFGSLRKSLAKYNNNKVKEAQAHGIKMHSATSHLCSGISGILSNSWVLEAPFAFSIKTNGDGESANWATPISPSDHPPIEFFLPEQWADHVPRFPQNTLKSLLKVHTGWSVKCPKGYALAFMPLDVLGENRFSVFAGPLVASKNPNLLNIVLYWHELNSETIIEAGTPLCLLTPMPHNQFDMAKAFTVGVKSQEDLIREKHLAAGLKCTWGSKRHGFFKKLFEE